MHSSEGRAASRGGPWVWKEIPCHTGQQITLEKEGRTAISSCGLRLKKTAGGNAQARWTKLPHTRRWGNGVRLNLIWEVLFLKYTRAEAGMSDFRFECLRWAHGHSFCFSLVCVPELFRTHAHARGCTRKGQAGGEALTHEKYPEPESRPHTAPPRSKLSTKGQTVKPSRLCHHHSITATLPGTAQLKISQGQYVNEWADHKPIKLYLWTVKIKFYMNVMRHKTFVFRLFFSHFKIKGGIFCSQAIQTRQEAGFGPKESWFPDPIQRI